MRSINKRDDIDSPKKWFNLYIRSIEQFEDVDPPKITIESEIGGNIYSYHGLLEI